MARPWNQWKKIQPKQFKDAVIVGGGLIGVEMAEMLLELGVSELRSWFREKRFWGKCIAKRRRRFNSSGISKSHHVDLRFETELEEILPDDQMVESREE